MKDILVIKADQFAHKVYKLTKIFPKEEVYGIVSQLRRSSLSVVLNTIEGFARNRNKEYIHFLEMSYGSLKETKYLLHFSLKEAYYKVNSYKELILLTDEIGKMLWARIEKMKRVSNR